MTCLSARLLLIPLVCALMAQHSCSLPELQLKRTLEKLALPKVTCYVRRIKAVFGPMVKSNIHVKGKNVLKSSSATSMAKRYQSKQIVWLVYFKHLHGAQRYQHHILFCCSFLSPQTSQGPQSLCLILKSPVEWGWPEIKTVASHSSVDMTAAMPRLR